MKKPTIQLSTHSANTKQSIRAKHFFNSAFKTFSLADNVRSIPAIDGLKPSQRKALHGTLDRGENAAFLQVERLASLIAAITDYHHGAGSMESTIAKMGAVKYPGSNNMNLFVPEGQFGSRLTKEAGAGRYIETKLSTYFRQLFKKEDDPILEHNMLDKERLEPKLYLPILPLVLINGASGTGTGHGCEIKSYHPNEIRDAVMNVLAGKKLTHGALVPWFRGYHGKVTRNPETGQVIMTGTLKVINSTKIVITELPVGVFLDDYKDHLNKLEDSGFIRDSVDSSTEEGFEFTITVPRTTTELSEAELYQKFKLIARDTENFTIWNKEGVLQRFASAEAIIEEFVSWRLGFYEIRRQKLISDTNETIRYQSELVRFIRFYLANVKVFRDTSKKELIEVLLNNGFTDYDRLLSMPIWNLTHDRIKELEDKLEALKVYLTKLEADTADAMYKRELKQFDYVESI
ncbi:DNA gyrase subunit A [Acinetobacter sp.]|uniref:DNA gyrase subunit A n=1 Tax=Acinetobacter sp. TaxID=472 RepID=UPI00388D9613